MSRRHVSSYHTLWAFSCLMSVWRSSYIQYIGSSTIEWWSIFWLQLIFLRSTLWCNRDKWSLDPKQEFHNIRVIQTKSKSGLKSSMSKSEVKSQVLYCVIQVGLSDSFPHPCNKQKWLCIHQIFEYETQAFWVTKYDWAAHIYFESRKWMANIKKTLVNACKFELITL